MPIQTLTSMRVIQAIPFGPPENLRLSEMSVPQPKAHEVLIKVTAAGVNGADLRQREGKYPVPNGAPDIMGLEISGTIVELGADCSRFKTGDKVCSLLNGGGYAEYAVVPEGQCMPIPNKVSPIDAAGLPEVFCTVWTNLLDRGSLKKNDTVLIHGGTSGIGFAAIRLAKLKGARVFSTARTTKKCAAMKRFGVDRAINYSEENFWEVCHSETGGKGVDIIVDIIGGNYIPKEVELLAHGGRLLILNLQGGKRAEIDFSYVHGKHLTITGSRLRPRTIEEKAAICRQVEKEIWPLFGSGDIIPETHQVFPFSEAAEAHRIMEASSHIGKIILTP